MLNACDSFANFSLSSLLALILPYVISLSNWRKGRRRKRRKEKEEKDKREKDKRRIRERNRNEKRETRNEDTRNEKREREKGRKSERKEKVSWWQGVVAVRGMHTIKESSPTRILLKKRDDEKEKTLVKRGQ